MDKSAQIKTFIDQAKVKVFLVDHEIEDGMTHFTFHTDEKLPTDFVKKANAYLGASGLNAHCKVKVHALNDLQNIKTLEQLVKSFDLNKIVYDSTQIITRAMSLVKLAQSIRAELSAAVDSMAFEARTRVVYVLLDKKMQDVTPESLLALKNKVEQACGRWKAETPAFEVDVRIGFDAPPLANIVAIDNASSKINVMAQLKKQLKKAFNVAGLAGLLGAGAANTAFAEPGDVALAVSQPNLDISAGATAAKTGGGAEIQLKGNVNLSGNIGVQLQGNANSDETNGVGGMLFYRDPTSFAAGISASHESYHDIDLNQYAAKVEMYLNNMVTVGAGVGGQTGDAGSGAIGNVGIKFYVTPDMLASLSAEHTPNFNSASAKFEYRPALESFPGLSIFADAEFGDHDERQAMLGLSYHFGEKTRTLLERDRYDTVDFNTNHRLALDHAYRNAHKAYTAPPP